MPITINKPALKNPDAPKPPVKDEFIDHLTPPVAQTTKMGSSTVVIEKKDGKTLVDAQQIEEQLHKAPPIPKAERASVTVGGSMSINLGNYESAKISVQLTMPCHVDEIEGCYEQVSTWVSDKIESTVSKAKKGI